jgi:hypothetical protein
LKSQVKHLPLAALLGFSPFTTPQVQETDKALSEAILYKWIQQTAQTQWHQQVLQLPGLHPRAWVHGMNSPTVSSAPTDNSAASPLALISDHLQSTSNELKKIQQHTRRALKSRVPKRKGHIAMFPEVRFLLMAT